MSRWPHSHHLPFMNHCFHLYSCQFRMVWGSLTHFSWDGCARNVNIFQYFFWPLQLFLILASARRNPYPCLIPALAPCPGPRQHTPTQHSGAFCPCLPGTSEKEKALKGRILSSLDRAVFSLLLRVAGRCGEFCRFLFSPSSFSFKSISPWPGWRVHLRVLHFLCTLGP